MKRVRGGAKPFVCAPIIVAVALLAIPREARADAYLPFAVGMSAASVAFFVLIVLLEALVLRAVIVGTFRGVLVTAAVANAASTVLGIVLALGVALAGSAGVDFLGVVALFVASVVVEEVVIRRRLGVPRARALAAALLMNAVSYAVLVPAAAYLSFRAHEAKQRGRFPRGPDPALVGVGWLPPDGGADSPASAP